MAVNPRKTVPSTDILFRIAQVPEASLWYYGTWRSGTPKTLISRWYSTWNWECLNISLPSWITKGSTRSKTGWFPIKNRDLNLSSGNLNWTWITHHFLIYYPPSFRNMWKTVDPKGNNHLDFHRFSRSKRPCPSPSPAIRPAFRSSNVDGKAP